MLFVNYYTNKLWLTNDGTHFGGLETGLVAEFLVGQLGNDFTR